MATRFASFLYFLTSLIPYPVAGQSPGPDWPKCSSMSLGKRHNPGWELLYLRYIPEQTRQYDPRQPIHRVALHVDVQNAADGSRTMCNLMKNTTAAADPRGEREALVIDSAYPGDIGDGCETVWVGRMDYNQTTWPSFGRGPTARVQYDAVTKELFISQNWTCRGDDGKLATFSGAASARLNTSCHDPRDEGPRICLVPELDFNSNPPVYIGPATVAPTEKPASPSDTFSLGGKDTACPSSSSPTGWQVLYMNHHPNAGAHLGPLPNRVFLELQNTADGSRTTCFLRGPVDPTGPIRSDDGEGKRGLRMNADWGCWTGRMVPSQPDGKPTGERTLGQEWKWQETAVVGFEARTGELSVNQTWTCRRPPRRGAGLRDVKVSGSASLKLGMECTPPGAMMSPMVCYPQAGVVVSGNSGPKLVGPAVLTFGE